MFFKNRSKIVTLYQQRLHYISSYDAYINSVSEDGKEMKILVYSEENSISLNREFQ
jgi:hypothetical protein